MKQPVLGAIAPFFIVTDVSAAMSFYCDRLGFKVAHREPDSRPFFGIVQRDNVMIFVKSVGERPTPNPTRNAAARWDAYVYVPDPDGLAEEFASRGVRFSIPIADTHDGLRGFELIDADGYVLFFGRPRE